MIFRAILSSLVAALVYMGFMWLLDDFTVRALVVFFGIVLVFNLFWEWRKARKAQMAQPVTDDKDNVE